MATVIRLNDGSIEIVSDLRDFLELVTVRMGSDASSWLKGYLLRYSETDAHIRDLEDEIGRMREHRHEVMEKLRQQSEIIAELIREKTIDRRALSNAAGEIGVITWKERNT